MPADHVSEPIKLKRVYVEISNVCNLKCSFCPEVKRSAKDVSLEEFRRTIEAVKPHTSEVYLHLMGEPLAHKHLNQVLAICEELAMQVKITTNGTLLNQKTCDLLLATPVRQVNFSLHSFADNFRGRSVSGYLGKILQFADRAATERPDLYLNFRLWDLDEDQAGRVENQELRRLIEEKFDVDLSAQKPDIRRRKGLIVRPRQSVHFDSRFVWPSLDLPELSAAGRCQGLMSHVGVLADGTVVPCCLDKEGIMALGNVREASLAQILDGPKAHAMRTGFKQGRLVEDLCRRCSFATRFNRKRVPRVNKRDSQQPNV